MTKTKKVLLITDRFPPQSGGASLRMRGLAKYLPLYGWEPTILTVDLPGEAEQGYRVLQVPYPGDVSAQVKKALRLNPQEGLQSQLGLPNQISTAKEPITGKIIQRIEGWFTYPDQKRRWKPVAVAALRNLLSQEAYQALISSSPPVITHLIAKETQGEFEIPWIADFRDLWTENHYYPYDRIRRFFDRRLELATIAQAAALVTVSEPLSKSMRSLHDPKPVFSIPNGFDPDEIMPSELQDTFSITYTGQLYQGKRDPELLFKVVRALVAEGILGADLRISFYGTKAYWVEELIKKYHLENIAIQFGKVEREQALQAQRSSQILLTLNWDTPQEEGVYTGKIFEYLAARRPILALGGPQGVVSELLAETQTGVHVRSEAELRQVLTAWYDEFQHKGSIAYRGNDQIYNYSHKKMAQKFSDVLNEVSQ